MVPVDLVECLRDVGVDGGRLGLGVAGGGAGVQCRLLEGVAGGEGSDAAQKYDSDEHTATDDDLWRRSAGAT
jgi:hypothetical protein